MPGQAEHYRAVLAGKRDVDAYLKAHSGLPGPRANLELVRAAGDVAQKRRLLTWTRADDEFLALCGAAGLGRFALDDPKVMARLRELAADARWRVREGVAMALQRVGDQDMDRLISAMRSWAEDDDLYVRRAAAAGLCEPRLLKDPKQAADVVAIIESMTRAFAGERERKSDSFRVLRQALGYCLSVAAAASPSLGRRMMETWVGSDDPDVRWIVKSNLGRARMVALGSDWLERNRRRVDQ